MGKFALNRALLTNWQNWARVLLMAVIGFLAFDLISRRIMSSNGKD